MVWVSLCQLDQLADGKGKYVDVGGFKLAVFLHGGRVFAMDHYCPHAGGNLAGGYIENGCIVCPWHHWAFDLESGELRNSSSVKVNTYRTRVLERENAAALVQADLSAY